MNAVQQFWKNRPLTSILLVALAIRLIAVFFAQGYLMHDDHFLVVEPASSWVVGEDHNNWLPENMKPGSDAHSVNFTYVGTQYVLLKALYSIGIEDPKTQMYWVRFIHALYSLLIVFFGFKIAHRLSNLKTARTVGLILALLAFMPNFAIRNLVEMMCIPPLMWSLWMLVKYNDHQKLKGFLLAAIGVGIATGMRYQCGVFGVGIGLGLLLKKEWKGFFILGGGSLLVFFLAQSPDLFIWGEPFKQLRSYIEYNLEKSGDYPNGPWYRYILTTVGFLLPPVSIFLLIGFFREARKYPEIFWPAFIFIVFHSLFPNKQERFILPALPVIITLGMVGWNNIAVAKEWTLKRLSTQWFWLFSLLLTLRKVGLKACIIFMNLEICET
ncbi:MAG: glycosyltransferase family 39 protein [Flavobacteriales bacterium]|nr:glycosyltransferase family 39 protein [Flavobacteriales bacterium]